MTRLRCPRCGGSSWLEQLNDGSIVQRCLCGLMNFLFQEKESGVTIMKRAVRSDEIRLPPDNTKLKATLMGVASKYPKHICTSEVAAHGGLKAKETASLVMLLMTRGLVFRVEGRRGVMGGSLWKLTDEAAQLLSLKERL